MAIFNSYVCLPERTIYIYGMNMLKTNLRPWNDVENEALKDKAN